MPPKCCAVWKQEDFIYDLHWGEKIDGDFIDFLEFEARIGNFVWPDKVQTALVHAIDMINHNKNQEFSYVYGLDKLDLLQKRYKTFSWMLGVDKVCYVA